jgi:hypothetical protein
VGRVEIVGAAVGPWLGTDVGRRDGAFDGCPEGAVVVVGRDVGATVSVGAGEWATEGALL